MIEAWERRGERGRERQRARGERGEGESWPQYKHTTQDFSTSYTNLPTCLLAYAPACLPTYARSLSLPASRRHPLIAQNQDQRQWKAREMK